MCMNVDDVEELEAVIGKVEEMEADDNEECIRKHARAKISVDIMKPLKKIIYLEYQRENKILIPVLYEDYKIFASTVVNLGINLE